MNGEDHLRAVHLRTEYLKNPLGIDIRRPRFYWNCEGGQKQSAYRLVVYTETETLMDSGKTASCRMTHIAYEGRELKSREHVYWKVMLWDEADVPGPWAEAWFEMGLLESSDWLGHWICGDYKPRRNVRRPVDCFRRKFRIESAVCPDVSERGRNADAEHSVGNDRNVGSDRNADNGRYLKSARLYITACGIYEAVLNGERVGDFCLAPGSTDYRKRLQYQTYDVTPLLRAENTLEVAVADGWYCGSIGCFGVTRVFGRQPALLCQLELYYGDGTVETVASGPAFDWSDDGPVRFADLKDGEIYDAAMTPSYEKKARLATGNLPGGIGGKNARQRGRQMSVAGTHGSSAVLAASNNVFPKAQERFKARLLTTPSGSQVLDFGQNIAGFISFKVRGRKGQKIRLLCGEMLDASGEFTQSNMQSAKPVKAFGKLKEILLITGNASKLKDEMQPTPKQEIVFYCSGHTDVYRMRFAVFGFRYALIETEVPFDASDFEAIAVYSDMEPAGDFACSNEKVNRFLENTRWSMKSNFLDVPTDCPTRERLGWTGDAQVFFNTAAYLMDVSSFYRKWLWDMADNQFKDGKISAVMPYNGASMLYDNTGGSVGWGDAAVLVPYRYWKCYGDRQIIKEFYPMMRKYAIYMIEHTGHKDKKLAKNDPLNDYVYEKGLHLGEWLEPEKFADKISAGHQPLHTEECTAYLHYTMSHMAEVARELDMPGDEKLFDTYAKGAKAAYDAMFLKGGAPDTDRQAKLVRPLAFGLADGEKRDALARRLAQAVEHRGYCIGTGFLSTPFVLRVLTEVGQSDLAYRMLENEQAPGWLYEVNAGATTVWEDWEGKLSQNHYSPGAVCQWLFDTAAGIRVDGENHFLIAPVPGGTLTWVRASWQSIYGRVESRWEQTEDGIMFHVTLPANTTARVVLPDGREYDVESGEYTFSKANRR